MGIFFTKKLCYHLIILSCFACFCITPSNSLKCFGTFKWVITINDGIPNSTIDFHVKSRDDDLGSHSITYDNNYAFEFCENFVQNTVFWADFYYGKKFVHFNVFDSKVVKVVGGSIFKENPVFWLLKDDGYYLSKKALSYNDSAWIHRGKWS
ncbi:putative plant self-incompatibility S1 [Helianthus annuus]|uniref:S-protein homolog n=1 Tax=Helianthus annuus TaxID=4232 RepID=A0A251ULJ7_HELAN|nr:putative plant self-incompatibility S1 [Helianthus annuus]KAJ0561664.1 putative plant self-incompatibility S1 [Helianthus annuus]KAJ0568399.1 putative plant self-incompatibility S1 [Helianthus annuus]KAJ0574728.1 putative plant self-incompatibility S1 [Helianthus annuus]KAJ0739059.1 putative plant self-incompatibility S1 [Helianthus annuus]